MSHAETILSPAHPTFVVSNDYIIEEANPLGFQILDAHDVG